MAYVSICVFQCPSFEAVYTNVYHIGPSDGAMSRYALRLEIYGATYVYREYFCIHYHHRLDSPRKNNLKTCYSWKMIFNLSAKLLKLYCQASRVRIVFY